MWHHGLWLLSFIHLLNAEHATGDPPEVSSGTNGECTLALCPECDPAKTDTAQWLKSLAAEEQAWITSQQWYEDWLSTTTTLCTDLSKITTDNPDISRLSQVVWREDSRYLYRGASGRAEHSHPDSVFEIGLVPWRQDAGGSLQMPNRRSRGSSVTSTTYVTEHAAEFGNWLYVIDAPGGVLVDESRAALHPGRSTEWEVDFPGGVKAKYIRGAYEMSNDVFAKTPTRYLPNPNYWRESQSLPDESHFDLVIAPGDPSATVSVHPAGDKVDSLGYITRQSVSEQSIIVSIDQNEQNGERYLSNWKSGFIFDFRDPWAWSTCIALSNFSAKAVFVDAGRLYPESAITKRGTGIEKSFVLPDGQCLSQHPGATFSDCLISDVEMYLEWHLDIGCTRRDIQGFRLWGFGSDLWAPWELVRNLSADSFAVTIERESLSKQLQEKWEELPNGGFGIQTLYQDNSGTALEYTIVEQFALWKQPSQSTDQRPEESELGQILAIVALSILTLYTSS